MGLETDWSGGSQGWNLGEIILFWSLFILIVGGISLACFPHLALVPIIGLCIKGLVILAATILGLWMLLMMLSEC